MRWSKKGLVFDPDAQALSEVSNKHRHHNTLRGTSSAANATIESLSSTGEGAEAREGLQPWHEVRDTLLQCSLLVGLHPDQAVGAIVDFALTFNKPFAVLPCCVYSKHFPKRHLPGPPRKQVTSYEDLCQWICNKNPDIQRTELPIEGKNVLLYWIPPHIKQNLPVQSAADEQTCEGPLRISKESYIL